MIYISLGSNLGHRMAFLHQAVACLKTRCLSHIRYSLIIETAAITPDGAPPDWNKPFLNMIVAGNTGLSPEALLAQLKNIERELGRPAVYDKWAPRVIDLDIVWWDELTYHTPTLTIPHTELPNRPFLQRLLHLFFQQSFVLTPALVGIVNITPDSFSDGGESLAPESALQAIQAHLAEGATLIELGAQSTRPGATRLTADAEYARLEPVLTALFAQQIPGLQISIDTFQPEVIQRMMTRYPIQWINDVTGQLDEKTLCAIREAGCGYIAMHALSIPPTAHDIIPLHDNPLDVIHAFFDKKITQLQRCGFASTSLMLDPGIGFGKSRAHNLLLLRDAHHFKQTGFPIVIGHSRKSYLNAVTTRPASERDIETLGISAHLAEQGIDFLRVHNIPLHHRFFAAQSIIT